MEPDFLPPEVNDPPEEEPRRRPGRARERYMRRKGQLEPSERPASRASRHLTPPDMKRLKINLPTIRIPRMHFAVGVVIGAVLIVIVIFLLRQIKPPEPENLPHALWIGTEWTYAIHEPEAIAELVAQWQENEIGTVYAWVSWLQEDETWRGAENFVAVQEFARQVKAVYPQLDLHGWISFPVNLGENGYRLDNETLQQMIADFSANVVNELGFDGVFLNIEPVWDADENFLSLLRKVRTSVGEDVPVSVAIPPDWSPENASIPVPPLIVPGTIWETDYKQSVALLSDQMVVMAYNSGLSSPDDYAIWVAYQVETFARAVSELGEGTQLIIGIPTYDAEPPGHDPLVENVESALTGYERGLAQASDAAAFVRGVAIYAGWTTDDLEWAQFGQWLSSS